MNYKYAYIKDGKVTEIRPTMTEIPQEMWSKKGLLPYELNVVSLPEGEETILVEGYDILEDKVIETKITRFKVPNLAEYKELQYEMVKSAGSIFIFSKYSLAQQTSALAGFYSTEENEVILSFAKTNFDKIRSLGVSIRASKTKDEVDTFQWVD